MLAHNPIIIVSFQILHYFVHFNTHKSDKQNDTGAYIDKRREIAKMRQLFSKTIHVGISDCRENTIQPTE